MAFAQYSSNNRTGLAACFGNYYQWGFQSAKLSAWYPPLPSTSKPQRPLGVQQIAPGVQLLPPPPPPPASAQVHKNARSPLESIERIGRGVVETSEAGFKKEGGLRHSY
ncbi:Protein of unknown function [Cotesia congregata]|uniref:Uncharacterized protein n=1 Tax=Cotesia congregata TaxID=51543 RepID=A0A8J2H6R9_COTCN|nr:Protein of unknown function [Cotesia congregata]